MTRFESIGKVDEKVIDVEVYYMEGDGWRSRGWFWNFGPMIFKGSEERPNFNKPVNLYNFTLWSENSGVESFGRLQPEREEKRFVFVVEGISQVPYLEVDIENADSALSPSGEPYGIVSKDETGINGSIVKLNPYNTLYDVESDDEVAVSEEGFRSNWIPVKKLDPESLSVDGAVINID